MTNKKGLFFAAAAAALALGLGFSTAASAETQLTTVKQAHKFVEDSMPGDSWQKVILASVDFGFLVGKPYVAVVNDLDERIDRVVCDSWDLVGQNAWWTKKGRTDIPSAIASHRVVITYTEKFDGYCGKAGSLFGVTESGAKVPAVLNADSFTNATTITFKSQN